MFDEDLFLELVDVTFESVKFEIFVEIKGLEIDNIEESGKE